MKNKNLKVISPPGLHFWLCFEGMLPSLRCPDLALGRRPRLLGHWGSLLGRMVLWLLFLRLLLLLLVSR